MDGSLGAVVRVSSLALGLALAIAGAGLVGFWAVQINRTPPRRSPSLSRQEPERQVNLGRYYRFKLDLTYKKAPIHIEFVGGCGVRSTFSIASGGSTVETLAMSAFVFGARIPEGHAIVVRSNPVSGHFDVCRGATTLTPAEMALLASCRDKSECKRLRIAARHKAPPDWLPLLTWYEHDDDFSFGIAYVTQDAYASPQARFGFVRATVEHATRADFEAFERTGPRNLLPSYLSDSLSHLDAPYLRKLKGGIPAAVLREPRKAWRYEGHPWCRG